MRKQTLKQRLDNHTNKNGPIPAHNPKLGRCWLFVGAHFATGYGEIFTTIKNKWRPVPAHRVAFAIKIGKDITELPKGLMVCHACNVKDCIRPSHLYAGNAKSNAKDRSNKSAFDKKNDNATVYKSFLSKGLSTIEKFWVRVQKTHTCWVWIGGLNSKLYGCFSGAEDSYKRSLSHRWIYEHLNGPIPDGMEILHTCDNPSCVRPSHLQLGTHQENMTDMATKRRNKHRKITDANIIEVRKLYMEGWTYDELSIHFGFSRHACFSAVKAMTAKYLGLKPLSRKHTIAKKR